MKKILFAVLALLAVPAAAQLTPNAGRYVDADGHVQNETVTVSRRESFLLASSNTVSSGITVFGGDYVFAQTCTGYGTVNLQVLGPDGATWQTVMTKTTADTAGGTGLALGSYASVRVTLSGTTGCAALLSRVPA